jgi:hypothetical protein
LCECRGRAAGTMQQIMFAKKVSDHVVLGSQEHVPNSAENDVPWLRHGTVPSSAMGPVPNSAMDLIHSSAMDKNPWLSHVATLSSAARRPPTQLWAIKNILWLCHREAPSSAVRRPTTQLRAHSAAQLQIQSPAQLWGHNTN